MISNCKRYRAVLRSTLPGPFGGEEVEVVSTSEHPASHYGLQVWVGRDGTAYGQIGLPLLGWDVERLEEVSPEAADAWLEGEE